MVICVHIFVFILCKASKLMTTQLAVHFLLGWKSPPDCQCENGLVEDR